MNTPESYADRVETWNCPDQSISVLSQAVLALAAEQHTANLIAYHTAQQTGAFANMTGTGSLVEIRQRLGIG